MEDPICIAIKASGDRCSSRKNATCGDGLRCKTHFNSIQKNGAATTRVKELYALQNKEIRDLPYDVENYHVQAAAIRARYSQERLEIVRNDEQYAAEAGNRNAQREQRRVEREERHRQRMEEFNQRLADIRARFALFDEAGNQLIAEPPLPPQNELAHFANDRQNVHTRPVIAQNTEVINKLKEIPVPPEYKWNKTSCSKTPFELGLECQLTPEATMNMVTNYCGRSYLATEADTKQYGEVLDGMWQFVKNSPHKEDLCKIIKTELQDSVGMCAMGNVSRVCNILAGYMDGVTQTESLSEKLGNLFAPLMEITDVNERMRRATKILKDNSVPRDQWTAWTDPLAE